MIQYYVYCVVHQFKNYYVKLCELLILNMSISISVSFFVFRDIVEKHVKQRDMQQYKYCDKM